MAVFRKVKKTDYTIIDNNIFKNKKLTYKAKGMICTMLSLPDDWNFSEEGLVNLSNEGISSVRSTLKELMEYGYLVRTRTRDSKGILREYIYTIYEEPTLDNQKLEQPTLENPRVDKPTLENLKTYKILNNKILNNKYSNSSNNSLFDLLQENGFKLTPIQIEKVTEWEDNELTRYAIKKAILGNHFNVSYIDSILYSYKKNNITTVEQALDNEENYKNSKNTKYVRKKSFEETLDEWVKEMEEENGTN